MRHYVRNMTIAIAMLILAFVVSNPVSQKVGLGKDLRGGASLIYAVDIGSSESASEVISQVIEVLKDRIDPNGLFEISIVRQGQDRIEITMPLPSVHVLELKAAFEEELAKLSLTSIEPDEFEQIMRLGKEQRTIEMNRIGETSPAVLESLHQAAESFDIASSLRAQYDMMSSNLDVDEAILDELAGKAADADIRYDLARDAVLSTAVSPETVKRALEQSAAAKAIKDGDEYINIPSARERALTRIQTQYPAIEDQLDSVIAAYDLYSKNRNSLDDTADLKRLVQAAGVLSFRITVDPDGRGNTSFTHPEETRLRELFKEKGPKQAGTRDARWFKINKPDSWYSSVSAYESMVANPAAYFYNYGGTGYVVEEYHGDYYMLAWDSRGLRMTQQDGRWKVSRAYQSADQLGRPAIGFQMDPAGASKMGGLTGANTGAHMAVLLDDEVFTAPTLNARITNQGIIEGEFTMEEINYVIRVLGAGSLQAKLSPEPLSENTIAPELGADNLLSGIAAGKLALIMVSIFMVFYYFGYGLVAVLCLAANALLIVGAIALSRASLTLPGIAGIILTFGMAVDANVLIYERIREELKGGLDLRQAVKAGYQKALSSIVDGNVTNLIVCLVLANVGTQEIRGFAITLGIGVVCTMVSALFINRLIMSTLVDKLKIKNMSMLPMAFKPLDKILRPNINWIGLRWVTSFLSIGVVSLGIVMIVTQGSEMLDTEFRGGTTITLKFKPDDNDPSRRMTMVRTEVEDKIHALSDISPSLESLRNAEVIPVNPADDGVTSDTFIIKTISTDRAAIGSAISGSFIEYLDVPPPLMFEYSLATTVAEAPVYPIIEDRLGENILRPEIRNDIAGYSGGVAINIENLSPVQSLDQIQSRLNITRQKDDFIDIIGRKTDIIITKGSYDAVESFAIVVLDTGLDYFSNVDAWESEVAQREWDLVLASLANSSDQLSVQTFSPAIAENFRATAFAAVLLSLLLILIYIWVRFGSVRYSAAAIVALTHDVLCVIGFLALAEIIYDNPAFAGVTKFLMIEPFKIDLNLIAALLTIIGYSLNDTIVIMDRIRENKGKLSYASKAVINRSVNETVSRTLITSGTTILAVFILYTQGGQGVHAFSFALLVGVIVGTYSSIAVASPLVWSRKKDISDRRELAALAESATES